MSSSSWITCCMAVRACCMLHTAQPTGLVSLAKRHYGLSFTDTLWHTMLCFCCSCTHEYPQCHTSTTCKPLMPTCQVLQPHTPSILSQIDKTCSCKYGHSKVLSLVCMHGQPGSSPLATLIQTKCRLSQGGAAVCSCDP